MIKRKLGSLRKQILPGYIDNMRYGASTVCIDIVSVAPPSCNSSQSFPLANEKIPSGVRS